MKEIPISFGRDEQDIYRIAINGDDIERASCAASLGCHTMANLSWEDHIDNLVTKGTHRVHQLRELKRLGLFAKDLLTCY